MKRFLLASLVALASVAVFSSAALAQSAAEFKLGFKALADQLPAEVVGSPIENEYFNLSNGNSEQHTTVGLMVWRKADNWTAYTNGYMTWINGPAGVQSRLNTDRFDWEKDVPVSQPPASPQPVPPAPVTWRVIDKSADGFKISLPSTWQQVDLNSQDLAGDLQRMFDPYPDSGEAAQQLAVAASILKLTKGVFLGFPISPETAVRPGSAVLKIIKVSVPSGATLDSVVAEAADALQGAVADGTISALAHRRINLPAGQSEEFNYVERVKMGTLPEITAGVKEYAFVHNGYLYDVNFLALDSRSGSAVTQVSDAIMHSFQFTN